MLVECQIEPFHVQLVLLNVGAFGLQRGFNWAHAGHLMDGRGHHPDHGVCRHTRRCGIRQQIRLRDDQGFRPWVIVVGLAEQVKIGLHVLKLRQVGH